MAIDAIDKPMGQVSILKQADIDTDSISTQSIRKYFDPITKETAQKQLPADQIAGIQYPPFNPTQLAEIYTYSGYHTRCINLKAIITAGLGYDIHPTEGGAEKNIKDPEYVKLKAFLDAHSGYAKQTVAESFANFATDFEIFGSAQFEIARNMKGEVAEFYHFPGIEAVAKYVALKPPVIQLIQMVGLAWATLNPLGTLNLTTTGQLQGDKTGLNEYIRMKNYNPKTRFYGLPEYLGCLGSILLDRSAVEYNINKFDNMGIPAHVTTIVGGDLSAESKKEVHSFFTNKFKGLKNVGRNLLLIFSGSNPDQVKVDIKSVEPEVKDASFQKMRIDARDEIITTHGVPKRLLGLAEAGSLGGSSEGKSQLKIFQECVIEPKQERFEQMFNNMIREGLKITKYEIKLNQLYVEDPKSDGQFYAAMAAANILFPDEIREELGYAAMDKDQLKIYQERMGQGAINALVKVRKMLEKSLEEEN